MADKFDDGIPVNIPNEETGRYADGVPVTGAPASAPSPKRPARKRTAKKAAAKKTGQSAAPTEEN